jgi:putative transposase
MAMAVVQSRQNYRRVYVPGGSFFFTLNVHRHRPLFESPRAVRLLGSVYRRYQMRWPFIDAGAANVRQFAGECPWVRASVGRPTFIGNAGLNKVNAIVLLPDHLHAIWTLPRRDGDYSKRWGWLKKELTQQWRGMGGKDHVVSEGRKRERRRGIWQPRFWEHTPQDEDDF